MKRCVLYKKLAGDKIQCLACNHFCKISEGHVGICGVRQNKDGKLNLLVYGKAIGVGIDPIEKKPFYHFLPGSFAYSLGTFGCNFRCGNCQNFEISQILGLKGRVKKYDKISWGEQLPPEEIVKRAKENNCKSIAYTYNEPTIWAEYALDTMKLARKSGLKNVWVSNGFMSRETLDLITPYLDAINIDIKSFDEKFYMSNCAAKLAPVLENCQRIVKKKIWLEITTLVIPTLSDNEKMLTKLAKFIKDKLGDFVPWHLSAFSGSISWKLQDVPDTTIKQLTTAYKIGKKQGLKYIYIGNVQTKDFENTLCPKCKKIIFQRIGYNIYTPEISGQCPNCKNKIEGIFQ